MKPEVGRDSAVESYEEIKGTLKVQILYLLQLV